MIGKVGVNHMNQVKSSQPEVTKPAFKGQEEYPQVEELKGAELLANYSVAFINQMPKEKLALKAIPLLNPETSADKIEGERIYNSEGRLDSIVVENEDSTTIYYPALENPDFIGQVKVIDKATGKKVFQQENEKEIQWIYKFSNIGGKEVVESSSYIDGDVVSTWRDSIVGDRSESISEWRNGYSMSISDKRNYKRMEFDKDGNLTEVCSTKKMQNGEMAQCLEFFDGELFKASKEKSVYFKKFDLASMLEDGKFQPADRFPFTKLSEGDMKAEDLEGERTYYSNGSVESVMTNFGGVDTEIIFSPQGIVKSIKTDSKELTYDEHRNQIVTEKLGDNETRITTYFREQKGSCVEYQSDGHKQSISFDSDGMPYYYREETPDGKETCLSLNKDGFIQGRY